MKVLVSLSDVDSQKKDLRIKLTQLSKRRVAFTKRIKMLRESKAKQQSPKQKEIYGKRIDGMVKQHTQQGERVRVLRKQLSRLVEKANKGNGKGKSGTKTTQLKKPLVGVKKQPKIRLKQKPKPSSKVRKKQPVKTKVKPKVTDKNKKPVQKPKVNSKPPVSAIKPQGMQK